MKEKGDLSGPRGEHFGLSEYRARVLPARTDMAGMLDWGGEGEVICEAVTEFLSNSSDSSPSLFLLQWSRRTSPAPSVYG